MNPQSPENKNKVAKKSSSLQWFAILTNHKDKESIVVAQNSQKELKEQLTGLDSELEVNLIIKGKAYTPRIQRAFDFVEGGLDVREIAPHLDLVKNDD